MIDVKKNGNKYLAVLCFVFGAIGYVSPDSVNDTFYRVGLAVSESGFLKFLQSMAGLTPNPGAAAMQYFLAFLFCLVTAPYLYRLMESKNFTPIYELPVLKKAFTLIFLNGMWLLLTVRVLVGNGVDGTRAHSKVALLKMLFTSSNFGFGVLSLFCWMFVIFMGLALIKLWIGFFSNSRNMRDI